jgi:hypothetical protein
MTHRPFLLLAALCLATAFHPARAAATDVTALLRAADKWRLSSDSMQVETQVQVFNRDGTPDKERRYTVFAQAQHRSLVLMRSPAEAGQKVLMLGDDFWLLMPGSQRPLRITPLQKLLGDASTGDIATLSWAEDYDGELVGEEPCGSAPARACQHLSLHAMRKGVSYQRIELWLAQPRHEPVRAELYVQSDKLAKQAQFVLDPAGTGVAEMVLQDQLSSHKETRVRYLSRASRSVPDAWMNPMFLARNPALE